MTDTSLTTAETLADGVVSVGPGSKAAFFRLLITGSAAEYGPKEMDQIITALRRRKDALSDPRLPDFATPFDPATYIRVRAELGYRDYVSEDKRSWVTVPATRAPDSGIRYSADVDFWLNEWAHKEHSQEALHSLVFDYMLDSGRIGEAAAENPLDWTGPLLMSTEASRVKLRLRKEGQILGVFDWDKENVPELLEELLDHDLATEDEVAEMLREAGLANDSLD